MKEILNRLRSKVVICSLLALIFFIVKYWIGFEIPEWDTFVTLLMAVLIGFGVLNNPTDSTKF